jgi:hypothetical protein
MSPKGVFSRGRLGCTHSASSRFRMILWALRPAVLGQGAWLVVANEKNLEQLQNPPRCRKPATIPEWNRAAPHFNAYGESSPLPWGERRAKRAECEGG